VIKELLHCLFRTYNVQGWIHPLPVRKAFADFELAFRNHAGAKFQFTANDFFINANDCVYYFPKYNWRWLGSSLVCVTALHHRPFPGAYKLPFGEGFYWVLPKSGDHGKIGDYDNLAPYEVT
jgi:hypothetical protein